MSDKKKKKLKRAQIFTVIKNSGLAITKTYELSLKCCVSERKRIALKSIDIEYVTFPEISFTGSVL